MAAPPTERHRLRPLYWLAIGLGAGKVPYGPGTAGTLLAIPLYLGLQGLPLAGYLAVVAAAALAGVGLCAVAARELGAHDHPAIVWDEIVGYLLTMVAAPAGWPWVVAGFVAFRVFDIAKPWPIRWLDRYVGGGWGIMLDDVLAGLYGWVVLQAVYWLLVAREPLI